MEVLIVLSKSMIGEGRNALPLVDIAVRREEFVDDLDDEVSELVAKGVAQGGEEVGRTVRVVSR